MSVVFFCQADSLSEFEDASETDHEEEWVSNRL